MAATVSATYASSATVTETFTGTYISSGDNTVSVTGLNETGTLNASSTVPATKQVSNQKALSTGTGTLDLTQLPGLTADETVSLSGLKVQILKLRNLSTNANKIVVSKGGSNGYQIDGATTWSIPLAPGQSTLFLLNDAADDVGGSNKNIDLVGTGSQVLEYLIVAG